jgi:hypothetical protein
MAEACAKTRDGDKPTPIPVAAVIRRKQRRSTEFSPMARPVFSFGPERIEAQKRRNAKI